MEWITLPNALEVLGHSRIETEYIYREVFVNRTYLPAPLALAPGGVVLDVGAHVGMATLFFAREEPTARILAFEPLPATFAALSANIARQGIDARAYNTAIADVPGRAELTCYPGSPASSSLAPDPRNARATVATYLRNLGLPAARAEAAASSLFEGEPWPCTVTTLSRVIAAERIRVVDLLKIDVENSEEAVLGGMADADWDRVRQVAMEVHDVDGRLARVVAELERRGLAVEAGQDRALAGTPLHRAVAWRP
jgi:31-O-methyltransferase